MKKLALNFTNHINNEDAIENISESITEFDLLSRNWTYTLIKKYLGDPDFKFTDLKFNKGLETNLYFFPRVVQIEKSKQFMDEYTQFDIREKLTKLGHILDGDYNSVKCKNCNLLVVWSRRKVQFTDPDIDYENLTCDEMIIKKILE